MVKRSVNVKRHLIAFTITGLVFVIGLLIGLGLTRERIEFSENFVRQQKADYDSLQLQLLYLEEGSCSALEKTLEHNINELEKQRAKLEQYIKDSDNKDLKIIEREYMLSEIRYWLLAKQSKQDCDLDSVSVLYFYSDVEGECEDCRTQGVILSFLKDKFKDRLLIFSIDVNVKDPMISIIKETEGINTLPALIIEDDKTFGLKGREDLKEIICDYYKKPHTECNGEL